MGAHADTGITTRYDRNKRYSKTWIRWLLTQHFSLYLWYFLLPLGHLGVFLASCWDRWHVLVIIGTDTQRVVWP